jgi:hypothetical protein
MDIRGKVQDKNFPIDQQALSMFKREFLFLRIIISGLRNPIIFSIDSLIGLGNNIQKKPKSAAKGVRHCFCDDFAKRL